MSILIEYFLYLLFPIRFVMSSNHKMIALSIEADKKK